MIPYGTRVPVAVRLLANCYTPFTFTFTLPHWSKILATPLLETARLIQYIVINAGCIACAKRRWLSLREIALPWFSHVKLLEVPWNPYETHRKLTDSHVSRFQYKYCTKRLCNGRMSVHPSACLSSYRNRIDR